MLEMEYEPIFDEVNCFEKLARPLVLLPAPLFWYSANNTLALVVYKVSISYFEEIYLIHVLGVELLH